MKETPEYKIDSDVPLYQQRADASALRDTIGKLEIGQSVQTFKKTRSGVEYALRKYPERKFAARKQPEGVRVWRTA